MRVNAAGLDQQVRQLGAFGHVANTLGKTLTVGLTLPIMAIGAGAIKAGAEFDKAFRDIQKVLASSGTSAGTTEQEFASLR